MLYLNEINNLYENGMFDEINYLYYEVFNENKSIHNKYLDLVKIINEGNYIEELFEVVKMTKEKSY